MSELSERGGISGPTAARGAVPRSVLQTWKKRDAPTGDKRRALEVAAVIRTRRPRKRSWTEQEQVRVRGRFASFKAGSFLAKLAVALVKARYPGVEPRRVGRGTRCAERRIPRYESTV